MVLPRNGEPAGSTAGVPKTGLGRILQCNLCAIILHQRESAACLTHSPVKQRNGPPKSAGSYALRFKGRMTPGGEFGQSGGLDPGIGDENKLPANSQFVKPRLKFSVVSAVCLCIRKTQYWHQNWRQCWHWVGLTLSASWHHVGTTWWLRPVFSVNARLLEMAVLSQTSK
jgi:hypothetical protein